MILITSNLSKLSFFYRFVYTVKIYVVYQYGEVKNKKIRVNNEEKKYKDSGSTWNLKISFGRS